MKMMSEKVQQQLVESVKTAIELHADGTPPTDAVTQVAKEAGYNEHQLKLMTDSFNTAKSLHHIRTADEMNKSASFDLADFDAAKEQLFPSDEEKVKAAHFADRPSSVLAMSVPNFNKAAGLSKTAASSCGSSGGAAASASAGLAAHDRRRKKKKKEVKAFDFEDQEEPDIFEVKGAEELQPDHGYRFRTAWKKLGGYLTKSRTHRKEAESHRHTYYQAAQQLGERFRAVAGPNWPDFRKEAEALYGDVGSQVCQAIETDNRLLSIYKRHGKSAEARPVPQMINDLTVDHKLLKIAVHAVELSAHEQVESQRWEKKHAETREALLRLGKSEKQADIGTMLGITALNRAMNDATKNVLSRPPARADLEDDADLDNEYNKTRIGLAVKDMMDSDEVVGQHASEDPARVAQVVDQLVQVSPRLLDMPLALQSAVRRQLEMGTTEPFELQQIRDLSKPLATPTVAPAPQGPGANV